MSDTQSMNPTTEASSARLGKIARLPFHIRQALNERLEDNEPSQRLVKWLNSQPAVQRILEDLFDGRPISEQNLSAWKQGGFRDWQRNQQTRVRAREFLDEAEELEEELYLAGNCDDENHSSMLDRVANRMALSLLELFREAEQGEKGPQRTRTMLDISLQLTRLRRGDHHRRRADLADARREDEKAEAAKKEYEAVCAQETRQIAVMRARAEVIRENYIRDLAIGNVSPRREKQIREYYAANAEAFRHAGIPDLPEGEDLAAEVEEVRASRGGQYGVEAVPSTSEPAAKTGEKRAGRSKAIKASQGG